jgi:hypothetical protein
MKKQSDVARPSGPEYREVLAVVYDKSGQVMVQQPFTIGRDQMGHGRSMAMGAVRFVDPKTGKMVQKWDPWGILDEPQQ